MPDRKISNRSISGPSDHRTAYPGAHTDRLLPTHGPTKSARSSNTWTPAPLLNPRLFPPLGPSKCHLALLAFPPRLLTERMPLYSGRMTTLPPRFSSGESHNARQMAESFGTDAERYDRTRPGYPRGMVERITAAGPYLDVLDVGIGTGISARPFQMAGCRMLGVDPDARMAEAARHRGFEVEVVRFEEWDPAGRQFDVVIAGQAWHWVDPVTGAAQAAEVLRPGGRLAVFWNVFQPPPDLSNAFAVVYRTVLPDSPFSRGTSGGLEAYAGQFTKAARGMRLVDKFGEPERWHFDWERSYTRDEWLDVVPTSGGHNQFPPGRLDELLAGLGNAIDAVGGSFVMRYTTVVITTKRSPA